MTVGSLAAVVVGLTLLVAGTTKLFNRQWRQQEIALGSPVWALPFVPPIEIILGALIAVRVLRVVMAVAVVALILLFTIFLLIKWDERRGESCNCFGMLSKRPASAWTILRNVALIALALVAAFVD